MNKKNATPNEVLACLKEGKSKRVKSSLDAIYKACEDQVKAGTLDFSYSNIALIGHSVFQQRKALETKREKFIAR